MANSASYFANFPDITYANNRVVDITRRVVVHNGTSKNPYVYYPLSLMDGVRADTVSYNSYDNPYLSWVVYLTNNITDPYYDWYLNQNQFDNFITLKYGSIANAITTIAFYTNDWVDQPQIQISAYDDLTANQQAYWEPVYGNFATPISYQRKKLDWKATTNYILEIGIIANTDQPFEFNEPVFISYNHGANGAAQVKQCNSSVVFVQHISGFAFPSGNNTISSNSYMFGNKGQSNVTITSCTFAANSIAEDEQGYYGPVYYYDLENQLNAANRFVNIMQPKYIKDFVDDVSSLLNANTPAF